MHLIAFLRKERKGREREKRGEDGQGWAYFPKVNIGGLTELISGVKRPVSKYR